ncbi:DUF6798 domain-containing protein [Coleofasciculus sp. F4-SAH-05]|uniref:DUF6798 domain-containing protein n=1 Tax=Coleofasciculus sp. F4-SAH-05 TaxID=3069525 RepID=UPI0032F5F957
MKLKFPPNIDSSLMPLLQGFLLAVFVISAVILAYGYHFPHGNHTVETPPILSLLDSSLYPKDYFVQEMVKFTPRTYYNYLIYLLASIGIGVPLSYFMIYVVALASFIFGLQAIARNFCKSRISVVLLSFWGFTVIAGDIGGNALFRNYPIPSIYAVGIAIWGIYFSLRRTWTIAYSFFGIACLLQFLVGLLPALLVSPLLIIDTWRTRQWLRTILAFSFFAVGAGLVYIPMLIQGTTSTDLLTNREFVELYGFIRIPHHIIPSAWSKSEWIQLILFYGAGIICLHKTRSLRPIHRFGLTVVVGIMFLSLLVNFIFVEIFPIATVAKLQFTRMTPFAQLAILIGLTILFDEHFKQRNWAICLSLAVIPVSHHPGLLLLLFAMGLGAFEKLSPHLRSKSDLWLAAILVVGLYPLPLYYDFEAWVSTLIQGPVLFGILLIPHLLTQWIHKERTKITVAFTLALVMTGTLLLGISDLLPNRLNRYVQGRVAINRVGNDEVSQLALRFRELSPKDALVLVPPSVHKFHWLSQRSIVVNFRNFPFTDSGILEWKTRMEAVLGVPIQQLHGWSSPLDQLYSSQDSSALVDVAQRYNARYILSRKDWHSDLPGEVVDNEGKWVIWRIHTE